MVWRLGQEWCHLVKSWLGDLGHWRWDRSGGLRHWLIVLVLKWCFSSGSLLLEYRLLRKHFRCQARHYRLLPFFLFLGIQLGLLIKFELGFLMERFLGTLNPQLNYFYSFFLFIDRTNLLEYHLLLLTNYNITDD